MPWRGLEGEKADRGFSAEVRETLLEKDARLLQDHFCHRSGCQINICKWRQFETAWQRWLDKPPTIPHVY